MPFTFMPYETTDERMTRAQNPKFIIEPRLSLDMRRVRPLGLVLRETITKRIWLKSWAAMS